MEKTIINILALDKDVETVRATAKANGISFGNTLLTLPLSATGTNPATHWFCSFAASQETIDKILALQTLSEISIGSARDFLASKGLKYIITK